MTVLITIRKTRIQMYLKKEDMKKWRKVIQEKVNARSEKS